MLQNKPGYYSAIKYEVVNREPAIYKIVIPAPSLRHHIFSPPITASPQTACIFAKIHRAIRNRAN